ncbi:hypothetical protein ACFLUX_01165 [Chloroflexota bacterium]
MLILGHAGITLGAAVLLSGAATVFRSPIPKQEKTAVASPDDPLNQPESWLTSLVRYVDIRLLLLGFLLPDIIGKPLGHIFFRETLSSGRTGYYMVCLGGFTPAETALLHQVRANLTDRIIRTLFIPG